MFTQSPASQLPDQYEKGVSVLFFRTKTIGTFFAF